MNDSAIGQGRFGSRVNFDFNAAAGVEDGRGSGEATASAPETNDESLVSVIASDAFTESDNVQPISVSNSETVKSKAKTKSLTSYLGQVEPSEKDKKQQAAQYTEEYRAKINKATVPINRAPPAYSKDSDLATTLRGKSNEKGSSLSPSAPREKADDDERVLTD